MTSDEFRAIALELPETEERSHMNHPDFRCQGKIFATLGPDLTWGMAKLTPAQQKEYMQIDAAFKPAPGKWGEGGATTFTLASVDTDHVRSAIHDAWHNTAQKKLL